MITRGGEVVLGTSNEMEGPDSCGDSAPEKMSVSQRRAEIRRRKLMSNSEERMNRIMGIHKPVSSDELRLERLDKPNSLPLQSSLPKRGIIFSGDTGTSNEHSCGEGAAPFVEDLSKSSDFRKDSNGLRNRADVASESTPRGLNQYLTRFDEAMKLRNQLNSEKPVPDSSNGVDEMDSFRVFRLLGSAILAVFVRMSVCKYLSIFAPFLTLQLAFMGLSKYFPKAQEFTRLTRTQDSSNSKHSRENAPTGTVRRTPNPRTPIVTRAGANKSSLASAPTHSEPLLNTCTTTCAPTTGSCTASPLQS
ncbi:guided entry of tail-anchored proteins factor CAMLG isoform X1 [Aquarana catesbeiana]|uniref:guided entry of tail-anchored proteins factor CAMLG isoform X1 n=1 Tax=Aquarana catesbeiana TaxID=8400 RepID=UPI003CC9AA76